MGAFNAEEREYMVQALWEAEMAAREDEVPAGAIVVNPAGKIVGRGRNRLISLSDPTAHAEILALRQAAEGLGNYRLVGHVMFSTLEPCPMCLMAAIHARLGRIIFGAPEPRWGAAGSMLNLAGLAGLNHRLEVVGGLLADEARGLITEFFKKKRQSGKSEVQSPSCGNAPR